MVEILTLIDKLRKKPKVTSQKIASEFWAEGVIIVQNPFADMDEFRRSAFKRIPGVVNITKPGSDTWLRKS